jgi:branched-chain amino acid transport system permease protein
VVFWSPDGVIGLWTRWRNRGSAQRNARPGGGHG